MMYARKASLNRSELGPEHCGVSVMIVLLSDLGQHGKFVSVLKLFSRVPTSGLVYRP